MGKKHPKQQQQQRKKNKAATLQSATAASPPSSPWPFLVALIAVIVPLASFVHVVVYPTFYDTSSEDGDDDNSNNSNHNNDQCTLVMAPSTLPDSGWGMFTLTDRTAGVPLYDSGDPAIPVVDLQQEHAAALRLLLHDYLWQGHVAHTNAAYEGQVVYAALPGTGMLANSLTDGRHNVAPPARGGALDGTATHRTPWSGAVTEYRNFSFYTVKPIARGGEILVDYGRTYFDGRGARMATDSNKLRRPVAELRRTGHCLDHLRADGHRAVAARFLPAGTVVAPVPVLPLGRAAVAMKSSPQSQSSSSSQQPRQQLLLNYCYGHAESSLLLFPYAPVVNLINHAASTTTTATAAISGTAATAAATANVKLQWSQPLNRAEWLNLTVAEVLAQPRSGLVLELVATRPIQKGDEILLDYGPAYGAAWERHRREWQFEGVATPSYQLLPNNDGPFRTEAEQERDPYPANIFTSCLYRHEGHSAASQATTTTKTMTFPWSPDGVGPQHARPCRILERHGSDGGNNPQYSYTVAAENRPHMPAEERIPTESTVVVTGVPAAALRFADRTYTTDPHLPNAFRHEIRLDDGTFPDAWKDLRSSPSSAQATALASAAAAAAASATTRDAATATTEQ